MTSSYRGYARASDNLNSGKIVDPSQKILQRNQEFLEDYRRVREFEKMQEAEAFQQYQRNTQTQTNSQVDAANLQANYGRIVSDQDQANVRTKQQAMQLAFDRKAQEPSDWDKTLNVTKQLTGLSATVSKLYGDYKKAEAQSKEQKTRVGGVTSLQNEQDKVPTTPTPPVTPFSMQGAQQQRSAARIIGTEQNTLSAVQEQNGEVAPALQTAENAVQSMTPVTAPAGIRLRVKQGFAAGMEAYDGTYKDKNGQMKDWQSATYLEKMQGYEWVKAKVFSSLGVKFRNIDENLAAEVDILANELSAPYMAARAKKDLQAARANDVDEQRLLYQDDPSPINIEGLYTALQRQAGGDDRAARNSLFKEFESLNFDTTDVKTFLESKVPGLEKSWKEQFPGDAQTLLTNRANAGLQNAEAEDNAREIVDIQRSNAIDTQAIADLEDGVYNGASDEELSEKIKYYTALGDDKTVESLTRLVSMTPSAQKDARIDTEFNELLLNGIQGDLTPKMILESGMSNEKKTEWLGKVQEFNATAPNKDAMTQAKNYISDSLKGRMKFNPYSGKVKDPSLNRAIDSALNQYQADYKQAMLGGANETDAKDYALGRFQKEFGTDPISGRYRVGDPLSGTPDLNGASFIDPSFSVVEREGDYDYNSATLNRALTVPNALDQPGLIQHEILKNVSVESLTKKGMPPVVTHIAARSNKPAFEILNRQLKANGLNEIPKAVYTAATEAQNVVTGDLQQLLNRYPSPTRTDIAMVGSGQQAIYTQLQPTQLRGLDILAKYESGKWGYDAMNESGSDEGRTAHGSGSSVTKLGKSFTKMTVAEVMEHHAAGRLHAAGRYQFIASTFKEQVQKLGIPPTALFNEELQDYMASEYAKQVGWRGIWIGPTDNAGPQEQAVLDAMSAADVPGVPPWRQPKNMNPNVVAMTVRTKEQGPGSGYWNWDEQRNLWVKGNAN